MTSQLTQAQRRDINELEADVLRAVNALGPALRRGALTEALMGAGLSVPDLRYMSRMLDRRADELERLSP